MSERALLKKQSPLLRKEHSSQQHGGTMTRNEFDRDLDVRESTPESTLPAIKSRGKFLPSTSTTVKIEASHKSKNQLNTQNFDLLYGIHETPPKKGSIQLQ